MPAHPFKRSGLRMRFEKPFSIDPSATGVFSSYGIEGQVEASVNSMAKDLRAVVVGGGTGAPMSIRMLLSLGVETSAVVAMADDGGSTGVLREEADVTPPGDIRKCIAAFARDPQDPLVRAFRYRFAVARDHALGNLMLAALEDASGSFPEAIAICERLLDAQGHVYPSTLDHVTLSALARDGSCMEGQASACHSDTALQRVELHSDSGTIRPYEPALEAIRRADLIVLGPGSLYTSIIPNLLVPGVVDAIRESKGRVVFVCSVADVQGETWGLSAKDHVEALADHGLAGLLDYVLVHSTDPAMLSVSSAEDAFESAPACSCVANALAAQGAPASEKVKNVSVSYDDVLAIQSMGPVVLARSLADPDNPTWHSPLALREAFLGVMKSCRSPLK